jgi:hypothetical protein
VSDNVWSAGRVRFTGNFIYCFLSTDVLLQCYSSFPSVI